MEQVSNDIPAMDVLNVLQPTDQLNQYLIEPQSEGCQGFPSKQINILTAKILGGTTSKISKKETYLEICTRPK